MQTSAKKSLRGRPSTGQLICFLVNDALVLWAIVLFLALFQSQNPKPVQTIPFIVLLWDLGSIINEFTFS